MRGWRAPSGGPVSAVEEIAAAQDPFRDLDRHDAVGADEDAVTDASSTPFSASRAPKRWPASRHGSNGRSIPVSFYCNQGGARQGDLPQILVRGGRSGAGRMEDRRALPGVGGKTANLVPILCIAASRQHSASTRDVHRISNRLGCRGEPRARKRRSRRLIAVMVLAAVAEVNLVHRDVGQDVARPCDPRSGLRVAVLCSPRNGVTKMGGAKHEARWMSFGW